MSYPFPDAAQIPIEDIPSVLIKLNAIQGELAARLMANRNDSKSELEIEDELIDVQEAAELLAVNPDWLYRRSRSLPFARRLSRKNLRFSRKGLLAWRDRRKA